MIYHKRYWGRIRNSGCVLLYMQTRSALEAADASKRRDATVTARRFTAVSRVCGREWRSDEQTKGREYELDEQ